MAYLINRSANTTVIDLLKSRGTGATQDDTGTFGDANKTDCIIESIVMCATTAAVVDLRLETNAVVGDDRYIFDGLSMPAGGTVTLDTPIEFNRTTTDLCFQLASGDVTIFIKYTEQKKITT